MSDMTLSYSLVSAWERGDRERAVETFLHIDGGFRSRQMEAGSKFDKEVEEYVNKNKMLPESLGGMKLKNPMCKLKIKERYSNEIILSGEFDVWDSPNIIEIKHSAARDSADWIEEQQINWYFLLMDLWVATHHDHDPKWNGAEMAFLYRFDPVHRKYDRSIAYKSERRLNSAREQIEKVGTEIRNYFIQEGIV